MGSTAATGAHFNAADYLLTRQVEAGRGGRTAVRAATPWTYADLDRRVGEVAAGLRALGLHRDDRVVLVMADDVPMLTTILGAFRAGLVAVPLSTMFTGRELASIVADSGARTVVATPEFAGAVAEAVAASPEVEHVVLVGDGDLPVPDGVASHSFDDLLAAGTGGDTTTAPTGDDSWALWLYTSGTTGLPKAAMHRHANIRHVCETYGRQVLGITEDDVTFSVPKMFFAYGIGNTVFFPLSVGATTVLEPRRPTPDVVRERLERDRPTLFFGVPTFYAALVGSDLPDDTFASVRLCASAGEVLPAPLQRRFTERFGVEVLDGIGSTEALHIFLSNRPDDIRPGTTGTAVPGYDLQVRDAEGREVPDGEAGALFVRGASIALGYWHRTDASRAVFQGSGSRPATPTCAAPRATTRAWDATATCSRRAASGSPRPRWRAGCWSTPGCARRPWSVSPTRTVSTSRSPWSSPTTGWTRTPWSPGAATAWPTSRPPARWCWSTTSPRRPRASSSASRCGEWSRATRPPRRRPPTSARPSRSPREHTPSPSPGVLMPYVIASGCIDVNDKACVDECPVDCIYEGDRKSYIHPRECIDCGACEPVCPVEAITQDRRVADGDEDFVADNGAFFTQVLPGRDAPLGDPGGAAKVGDLGTDTELVRGWS